MTHFFHNLAARQSLIERFLSSWTQGYFWSGINLLEMLLATTILGLSYLFSRLTHRHAQSWWQPLLFPSTLFINSLLLSFLWQKLIQTPIVWLNFVIFFSLWWLFIQLTLMLIRYITAQRKMHQIIEKAMSTSLWLIGIFWLSGFADWTLNWSKHQILPLGKNAISLYTIINGIFWVLIILLLAMWMARLIETRLMKINRIDWNVRMVLANLVKMIFLLFGLLFALSLVGIDLTVLSVFGGALGVGLGFSLQKVASNYISGFIILLDHSIRIGDRLVLNHFTGYVSKITSRYVVVKNTSGSEALVPNETFITSTVINESYSGSTLWHSINLQVAYQTDIPKAMDIMQKAACKQARIEQNNSPPSAYLSHFLSSGIELTLGFWVIDPKNGFSGLTSDILLDIWHEFKAHGIEFATPKQDIHLLNKN